MPVIGEYVTTESRHDIKVPIADIVTGTVAAGGAIPSIATIAALRAGAGGSVDGQIIYVKGFAANGDGGEGHFVWNAASTATDNTGTIIKATPATGRWLRQFSGLANIKWWGAKGDNSTDDAPAVQAAVNSQLPLRVPLGIYRLYAAITWDSAAHDLVLIGDSGKATEASPTNCAEFFDYRSNDPDEPLFHRAGRYLRKDNTWYNTIPTPNPGDPDIDAQTIGRSITLKNIYFHTESAWGACFEMQGVNGGAVEHCFFRSNYRGLSMLSSTFDIIISNCQAWGGFFSAHGGVPPTPWDPVLAREAWGFYGSGHKTFINTATVGVGTGLRLEGHGNHVLGLRSEVCGYAVNVSATSLAVRGNSSSNMPFKQVLHGLSLENVIGGIRLEAMEASTISGVSIQGYDSGYLIPVETGIEVMSPVGRTCTISDVWIDGAFTKAGIVQKSRAIVRSAHTPSSHAYAQTFGWRPGAGSVGEPIYSLINSPIFGGATYDARRTITAFHDLMVTGLTGLNISDKGSSGYAAGGATFCRQLGRVETISNGASSKAITFRDYIGVGEVGMQNATVITDGGSTLAAGTWYYHTSLITPWGETGYANTITNASAVVTSGKSVQINVYGQYITRARRRVYRGVANGVYTQYVEVDGLQSNPVITDNGQLTWTPGTPLEDCSIPSLVEDDANYQIIATPSWGTTVYVTSKATTGFTLNFGTAAPDANQTVAWLMFRP